VSLLANHRPAPCRLGNRGLTVSPKSADTCHESGHVPVGQLELPDDEPPDFAAKVENIFSVSFEPHFSQA